MRSAYRLPLASLPDPDPVTKRTTLVQVEAALIKNQGIPYLAAQELGITRQSVCERIERNPRLQRAIADVEATILDAARAVVQQTLTAPDKRLASHNARWLLERKGRHLGFGPTFEARLADDQIDTILSKMSPEQLSAALMALRGAT